MANSFKLLLSQKANNFINVIGSCEQAGYCPSYQTYIRGNQLHI